MAQRNHVEYVFEILAVKLISAVENSTVRLEPVMKYRDSVASAQVVKLMAVQVPEQEPVQEYVDQP